MADRYLVATDRDGMILAKLATIEEALEQMLPLLTKIVARLEAQAKLPAVPVATYDQMYAPIEAGPPDGELVAGDDPPAVQPGGWRRLFPGRQS